MHPKKTDNKQDLLKIHDKEDEKQFRQVFRVDYFV